MNIEQFRAETPGTERYIHLNNAGAALMPRSVLQAMTDHLHLETMEGGYEAATLRREAITGFYTRLARLLQAQPHQIAFTVSATDAYNRALSSIPWERGDSILTTNNDYVSNQIAFLQLRQLWGVELLRAADLPTGGVDPESVEQLIRRHRPRLVAVTHVPTNSGLIQPVEAIGAICRQYECLYLVDACQSVGQLPVDVRRLHCDYLTATFRKFLRGPRGAGFLYISDRVLERNYAPLFLDLESATWTAPDAYQLVDGAHRFENWERPYAALLGASEAVEYTLKLGLEAIASRVQHLTRLLREQIHATPRWQVLDTGDRLAGIVSVHLTGEDPRQWQQYLRQHRINISVTSRHSALIDFDRKQVAWGLRLSPHYYNTEADITAAVDRLADGIKN